VIAASAAVERSTMTVADACALVVGLLQEIRVRGEMVSITMAMVCERDAALERQRQQLGALRDELRRYTSRAVGGRS
jgi:hypothetical protein